MVCSLLRIRGVKMDIRGRLAVYVDFHIVVNAIAIDIDIIFIKRGVESVDEDVSKYDGVV